jgi:hypothetical protein
MTITKIFVTLLLVTVINSVLTYDKVTIKDPSAVCLDGSPYTYYIHEGNPKKVLISMDGGAWCGDVTVSATL